MLPELRAGGRDYPHDGDGSTPEAGVAWVRDRILFETDCPYLSPDRARGSEPADVAATAAYAAELWRVPLADVVERTAENFERLFRIAP